MAASVSSTDVEGTSRSGAPVDGLMSVVVMSCSHPLEGAGELPVGHVGVEGGELDVGHVDVVVDDLVAERRPGGLGGGEQLTRVPQGVRDVWLVGLVGVADQLALQRQLVLDAMKAAGQHAGEGQVR